MKMYNSLNSSHSISPIENVLRSIKLKYVFGCILVTLVIAGFISIFSFSSIEECECRQKEFHAPKNSQHRLAILVPYRERFEELLIFVPHMKNFLDKQDLDYHLFILHQVDRLRFNRASLINVGFLEINKNYDYIAMHDVDLLPMNDGLKYYYPEKGPLHISSPDLHPRYHYPTFIGGILLIKREHFLLVNGMSNKYWGWGLEDDEFYVRLKEAGLNVTRPPKLPTGKQNTFRHIHNRNYRKRDMVKCYNQREVTRKRDRETGLNNVSYKVQKKINVSIGDASLTILNIELMCDTKITPWCVCDSTVNSERTTKSKKVKR